MKNELLLYKSKLSIYFALLISFIIVEFYLFTYLLSELFSEKNYES